MGIASITAQKTLVKGWPTIIIVSFEGVLLKEDLPQDYLDKGPNFYDFGKAASIEVTNSHNWHDTHSVGERLSPERFTDLITTLKSAGRRLTAINKSIEVLREKYNGDEFTIEI